MTHIIEDRLNEYLDGVLDGENRRAVDSHLEICGECRQRLADLQSVFDRLAESPPVALTSDFRSTVLAALPSQQPRIGSPAFAAQLGAGAGLLIWIGIQLAPRLRFPPSRWPQFSFSNLGFGLPELDFRSIILTAITARYPWQGLLRSPSAIVEPLFSFPRPLIAIPHLPIPSAALAVTTVLVLVLCGLVNVALLRTKRGERS
jgi:hypothetical protein